MHTLATQYRAAQLYAHRAHNLVSGPTFFADHTFLGDLYDTYADAYDSLIERLIGLGTPPNIITITEAATTAFSKARLDTKPDQFFKSLLNMEYGFQRQIKKLVPEASDGTANLLQGLADESEARCYKIKQRIGE